MPDIIHCTPDTIFCTSDTVHCTSDNVICIPDISFNCKIRVYAKSQEIRLVIKLKGTNQRICMPVILHRTPDSIECTTDNDSHMPGIDRYPLSLYYLRSFRVY